MLVSENMFWAPAPLLCPGFQGGKVWFKFVCELRNLPNIRGLDKIKVYLFLTFKKSEDAPPSWWGGIGQGPMPWAHCCAGQDSPPQVAAGTHWSESPPPHAPASQETGHKEQDGLPLGTLSRCGAWLCVSRASTSRENRKWGGRARTFHKTGVSLLRKWRHSILEEKHCPCSGWWDA